LQRVRRSGEAKPRQAHYAAAQGSAHKEKSIVDGSACNRCNQPLIEIDYYDCEQFVGCIECNCWRGGKSAFIVDQSVEDIQALRGGAFYSVVLLTVELSFFGTYKGGWTLVDAVPDLYRRGFRVVGCQEGWDNNATGEVLEGDFILARGLEP
jgi:hypothetical protein